MKKLLLLIPWLLAAPADASIYANLETREVFGIRDGIDTVKISDGNTVVETSNPNARFPPGTKNLEDGEEITVPMNDSGFRYYSGLHLKLSGSKGSLLKDENIDYTDPKYGIRNSYDCESKKYSHGNSQYWDEDTCVTQI